ncbi:MULTISPECIES: ABC transporter ATP-binding protein [Acidipropionibacterium]|uniref:Macrolide export ATP-binding/permease protein MacB n=1 Tax=Acidipropionibacterium jensenii TaxID=1749 RepID=A0A3S4VI94_9ACTN|nr:MULTISPECIES: ABC transporter ATP-binding protein [Acidipropionibacterium]MDN5976309.1 ABC transporter ATP-binding protein [Acidipropionibacterium jensenii]MDN5995394.1 ABC transporter ATP-binding protein [Acidipropionibacterium jensenii]MDN6021078.1 ABC transporter ATP-binding protein [Acidipropionibacterium jensenii]MDN6425751.1 ABC transporter ATP-binding protein [Acidipropionibacterium jensenii]MDN6440549.1 ABC transporter ATP-binding protein [Acidipropionibacterium jensenii]
MIGAPSAVGPVLEFVAAGRTYAGPPEVTALHPCSLVIERGDLVTVCGPSGSGKSTWLNLAGLLDRPSTGSVVVNAVDTGRLSADQRTAIRGGWLGFVFQSFHLMAHRSVLENVCLSGLYRSMPPARRWERASEVIESVGLGARLNAPARNLSGGEMQRTAIARAMMNSPHLMLCDEPTGNLDSQNGAQVIDLLDELHDQGMTIVIITHDPVIARHGDRQIQIKDGRVHEMA